MPVSGAGAAVELPVARVLPLLGLPHLDRLFDYSVPSSCDADAQPGVRVRIRFAGRLVDALVVERRRRTNHPGALAPIERVISPTVVMPEPMWALVNHLAEHYAGVRSDILRAAIPTRHAAAEKAGLFGGGKPWDELTGNLTPLDQARAAAEEAALDRLGTHVHGDAFMRAVLEGRHPRASLIGTPGQDLPSLVAAVCAAVAYNDGSVLVIVPNQKDVDRVTTALREHMGAAQITELTASVGPSARYRRYLSILAGQARVVVGTRSAAMVPLVNLRLIALLGESDDNLVDPRSPYVHAREVLKERAALEQSALLVAGVHRSAEIQQWIEEGFAHPLHPTREALRASLPWIRGMGETEIQSAREAHSGGARIPSLGFEAIRNALGRGEPALVQVQRRGYAPALACSSCRTPARCRVCNGPLELPVPEPAPGARQLPVSPRCRWCGTSAGVFTCTACGNHSVRMTVVGQDRTVEELGHAFAGVPIIASGGSKVLASIPKKKGIVVATPGAEPHIEGGLYGAAVLLDTWLALGREDLRAQEHALRQWMEAASLVTPQVQGGTVIVAAPAGSEAAQKLIRWDPAGAAARELSQRREVRFPPSVTLAAIDGTLAALEQLEAVWERPENTELLGPVELPAGIRPPAGMEPGQTPWRMIVRAADNESETSLGASLRVAQAVRGTHRHSEPLRIVIDPVRIG